MNKNEFLGQVNQIDCGSDSMTKSIKSIDLTLRLGATDLISEVNASNNNIALAMSNSRGHYVGPIRTPRINPGVTPYNRSNVNPNQINDRPGNGGLMRRGSIEPTVPHMANTTTSHGGTSAVPVTNPAGCCGGLANFSPHAFTPSPFVIGYQQNNGIGSHAELSDSHNYPVTNPAGRGSGMPNFYANSFTPSPSIKGKLPLISGMGSHGGSNSSHFRNPTGRGGGLSNFSANSFAPSLVKGKQQLNGMESDGGSSSSHYYPVTNPTGRGGGLSNFSAKSFTPSPLVNGKKPINGMGSHGGSSSSHCYPVTNPEDRNNGLYKFSDNSISASPSAIINHPNNGIGSHCGPSDSLSCPLTNSVGRGGSLVKFSANSFTPSLSSINRNHQYNGLGTHGWPSASHHYPETNPAGRGSGLTNFSPNSFTPSSSFTGIQQNNRNPYTRFASPAVQAIAPPVNYNNGFQPVGNSSNVQYTEDVRTGAIDAPRGGNNNATLEGHMYSVPVLNTAVKRCTGYGCNNVDTPMWRRGPLGPKTLCNACGIRYRKDEEKKRGITPTTSKRSRANGRR